MTEDDALSKLVHRMGLPKLTHYGQSFLVEERESANNNAYTNATLGLHTDLPFYEYMPGVIIMLFYL